MRIRSSKPRNRRSFALAQRPLKVELTTEEILADLRYPALDRSRTGR